MKEVKSTNIFSPVNGVVGSLENVADPMFQKEMLGTTVVFDSNDKVIYSPIKGKVGALYPSNHAIGIIGKDGLEVLIHVGIDTSKLNGEGFKSFVNQGDIVKEHDTLIKFDKNFLKEKGYSTDIFLIFTNSKMFAIQKVFSQDAIEKKDVLAYARAI